MSGPTPLGEIRGAIDTFAINERLAINAAQGAFRLDVNAVNDEAVFDIVIGGRLTGNEVLCPGKNANRIRTAKQAGALVTTCRRMEH